MGIYPGVHRFGGGHGKYLDVSHQSIVIWRRSISDSVLIFVALIGFTGVIGEMTFGRATRSGPIDAFGIACERKGKRKPGEALGLIPVVGSLAMAIGYTVVMGWILKYTVGAFTGATLAPADVDEFSAVFGSMASAFGNTGWQVVILLAAMGILMFGVGGGIEKVNKVLMPVFFLLFVGLGIYVAFQPGAVDGYHYIFRVDGKALGDPKTWIFALGQAFFSLSVAGNGTLIYGSYLSDEENIPAAAGRVAFFDTLAALLASLVIIPRWQPPEQSSIRAVPDCYLFSCQI